MALGDADCESLDSIRPLFAEHFRDFAFVVIADDGDFYYDYGHKIVGKALFESAVRDIDYEEAVGDPIEVDWDDDDGEEKV